MDLCAGRDRATFSVVPPAGDAAAAETRSVRRPQHGDTVTNEVSSSLRVPVPPPVLFFAFLAAGLMAEELRPVSLGLDTIALRLAASVPFFCLGTAVGAWALRALRVDKASPDFGRPVRTLTTSGPYRRTRNPLYVALVLVFLGFGLVLDSGWLALLAPALVLSLDQLVITREERFLLALFGVEYDAYCQRVRRWI